MSSEAETTRSWVDGCDCSQRIIKKHTSSWVPTLYTISSTPKYLSLGGMGSHVQNYFTSTRHNMYSRTSHKQKRCQYYGIQHKNCTTIISPSSLSFIKQQNYCTRLRFRHFQKVKIICSTVQQLFTKSDQLTRKFIIAIITKNKINEQKAWMIAALKLSQPTYMCIQTKINERKQDST